jgi:hypothetical protein
VLGVIATLIVLSVFQLYRSLEVTRPNPEISKSRELSTSEPVIPEKKFNRSPSHQRMGSLIDEIEILTIKNAIANGRF